MRPATSPTSSALRPLRSDAPLKETRWGSPWLALAALLAGAAAIRLVDLRYGLPFPLPNPDEENIVPRAWMIPLVWSIRDAGPLVRTDTRVVAHDWMRENLTPGVLVAADPGAAAPDDVRVLRFARPGPGRRPDARRNLARLRELNVGYVVVTGAVAGPVLAERGRYPAESRFYDQLDRDGNRRFYRQGVGKLAGPWVAVYEL